MSLQSPYHLLSGPKHSTSSSQPRFTTWFCLWISKPSISSSHLSLLCRSGKVSQAKHRWGRTLPVPLRKPRACAPNGEQQTLLEHHYFSPAQLILHKEQRLVVSGHSQSLQLTVLGKAIPLTCQQQSRLNYKRRVYSAHMEGTPPVSTLGDRGGCATGH